MPGVREGGRVTLPRPKAVLKWTGLALCILFLVAWIGSGWCYAGIAYSEPRRFRAMGIDVGALWYEWIDGAAPGPGTLPPGWSFRGGTTPLWSFRLAMVPMIRRWGGVIPLYIPLLLLAVLTVWLMEKDRRSARWAKEGRCDRCGYDLSTLTENTPCPECGKWPGW